MANFGFIILTSLCVQYIWGLQKTNILPTLEPYNQTHCKIFFASSFDELPKDYTAYLVVIDEKRGNRFYEQIQDNLVAFTSCIPQEIESITVELEIAGDKRRVTSDLFNYEPVNVNNTIKDHVCLNSDGTLGGEEEMKKKNKFFDICLKKMEIVNQTSANNITVRATFLRKDANTKNETVIIENLDSCGLDEMTIVVVTIIPVLVLLAAFAAYCFYRRNKEIEDSREVRDVNPTYNDGNYNYDKTSELHTSNDYYETHYTDDSTATEYNYQYGNGKNKNKL